MKKLALFSLIVFVVLSEVVIVTQAEDTSGPHIRFDHEMWSFGRINEGDKVTHVFKVENVGDADLILLKIRATCRCTVASVSSTTIKPGETSEIEAIFNSKGYHGAVTQFIYVESNDPQMPHKKLAIFGEVRASSPEINISIDPGEWKFFVPLEKEITDEFTIRNGGRQPLRIEAITTSSSQYEVSIPRDEIFPQYHTRATLKIKSGEESENSTGYIYLEIAIPFTTELKK